MKLLFVDVETTGISAYKNGIVQLSGIIDIDGEIIEDFNFKVAPFKTDIINPKAMEVNGLDMHEVKTFDDPVEVHTKFCNILSSYVNKYDKQDKLSFIAYNSSFDEDHIRSWFKKNKDSFFGSYFWWPSICVAKMAAQKYLPTRSSFPDFKLMTVAKNVGIEVDVTKVHDAKYDIEMTRDLYYQILREE